MSEKNVNKSGRGRQSNRQQTYEGSYYNDPQNYGQPYAGQPYTGQPYGGQPYTGQYYNGQPYDGQPYGGQAYNGQPYDNHGYYDQTQYGPNDRSYQNQGYYGQSYYNQQGNQQYYDQQYAGAQNYYAQPGYGQGSKKKKKKHRKLVFVLELIVILLLAGGLFTFAQLGRVQRQKLTDILVNAGVGQSGYRNIALFGVDSREGDLESGTNSDTIMVASINNRTGDIKLVSVYRDTYLDITNGSYSKANSAFAGGGAERAINMLNKNLDLDITDFATVDFSAVIEAVDLLGGVELDLTDEEVKWLNAYLVETSQVTGVSMEGQQIPYGGNWLCSGIQAMAYCRIRYTEGWDYKRTERQRIVLEKIFEKAKAKGITGLVPLINSMMSYISTSMSNTELIALATGIGRYNIVDTQGFPFEKQAVDIAAGDVVVPVTLASNVTQLHNYLFGDTGYSPSETVQSISYQIISETGLQ